MSALSDMIRRMGEAGASGEMIAIAVEGYEAAAIAATEATKGAMRVEPYVPRCRAKYGYDGPITPRPPEKEWLALVRSVILRDGERCVYCGADTDLTADHVVPLSRGGSNHAENLSACCLPCNSSKCDRLVSEWRGRTGVRA